jgi:hypothetical protein
MCQRSKEPMLVIEEEMRGFKAPELTQRSHEHRLGHSGVSGLILIPMKVVNENRGGG